MQICNSKSVIYVIGRRTVNHVNSIREYLRLVLPVICARRDFNVNVNGDAVCFANNGRDEIPYLSGRFTREIQFARANCERQRSLGLDHASARERTSWGPAVATRNYATCVTCAARAVHIFAISSQTGQTRVCRFLWKVKYLQILRRNVNRLKLKIQILSKMKSLKYLYGNQDHRKDYLLLFQY